MKGAPEACHQVEKIFLGDHRILYCTGCGACNTTHTCPLKDDMASILDKMVKADVIVMATPVYFYAMCGQMKTLIDRVCPRYTEVSNKEFYFIVTAADSNQAAMKRTIEGFRGFTECLENPDEKGIVYGVGAWKKGEIKETPAMQKTYSLGKTV